MVVPPEYSERKVKCPKCKAIADVPLYVEPEPEPAPVSEPLAPHVATDGVNAGFDPNALCANCGMNLVSGAVRCGQCGEHIAGVSTNYRQRQINTDDVQYAGFWVRTLAYVLDCFILGFINGGVAFSVGFFYRVIYPYSYMEPEIIQQWYDVIGLLSIFCPWLYFSIMNCSEGRSTYGKRIMGIVVTDLKGERISFGLATARYFCMLLSALLFCIGFIMVAATKRKQGLHDIMVGTVVVYN